MDCKETLAEKNTFSSIFSKTARKYLTYCYVVKQNSSIFSKTEKKYLMHCHVQNVLRAKRLAFKNIFSRGQPQTLSLTKLRQTW